VITSLKKEVVIAFIGVLDLVTYKSKTSTFLCLTLQALLSGCSAGGLATLIHCDDFRETLPKDANVKCLVDAGFFLNEYVSKITLHIKVPITNISISGSLLSNMIIYLFLEAVKQV